MPRMKLVQRPVNSLVAQVRTKRVGRNIVDNADAIDSRIIDVYAQVFRESASTAVRNVPALYLDRRYSAPQCVLVLPHALGDEFHYLVRFPTESSLDVFVDLLFREMPSTYSEQQ
jgi:hypothetical protein